MTANELIEIAKSAAEAAYAPYSGFCVGAALLCTNGKVFTGCNVENSAYPVTCCAERVALFKAVSEKEVCFSDIAIVGGNNNDYSKSCPPCGVCRQALSEFCKTEMKIHLCENSSIRTLTLSELLPYSFSL